MVQLFNIRMYLILAIFKNKKKMGKCQRQLKGVRWRSHNPNTLKRNGRLRDELKEFSEMEKGFWR